MMTACLEFGCAPSLNPIKQSRCVRCDSVVTRPEATRRNLELEREIVKQACKGKIDPNGLIEHSETRCERLSGQYTKDPMFIQPGRNLRKDGREEAVDGVNYCKFVLQEEPNAEDADFLMEAIGHFAMAYDLLGRVND